MARQESPLDFVRRQMIGSGLSVRRGSRGVMAVRPSHESQQLISALTFSCRRWDDRSYAFCLLSGARVVEVEALLAKYFWRDAARRRKWVALTSLSDQQCADAANWDDTLRHSLAGAVQAWAAESIDFRLSDVVAYLQSAFEASVERTLSYPEHPADAQTYSFRVVVVRDLFDADLPSNRDLRGRLRTLTGGARSFDDFLDWWQAHRHVL